MVSTVFFSSDFSSLEWKRWMLNHLTFCFTFHVLGWRKDWLCDFTLLENTKF
jgi:hypothetical protein